MTYIQQLKERVLSAEAEATELRSMLDAFFTGNVPDDATLQHVILAQWGRKRLDEKKRNGVLLTPQ